MPRRSTAWSFPLLVTAALVLGTPGVARAESNDEDVTTLVQSVLETEYLNTKFKEALEKLELAKQACEGGACSPKVRAQVHIALGTVLAGGMKRVKEAKEAFVTALRDDPTATLFGDYITAEVQKAFNDARTVASASSGSAETKGGGAPKTKGAFRGGAAPRGWRSAEAYSSSARPATPRARASGPTARATRRPRSRSRTGRRRGSSRRRARRRPGSGSRRSPTTTSWPRSRRARASGWWRRRGRRASA